MFKRFFYSVAVALFFSSCIFKNQSQQQSTTHEPALLAVQKTSDASPFNYSAPANLLSMLGTIRATYIITPLLFEPEDVLRNYCKDLGDRGFNLAFVNVQARGYVLMRKGIKVSTADGSVLMPGHPKVVVADPLGVIRDECSKQAKPVAVVPWIEFNAMAEQHGGTDTTTRGKGFDENGTAITLNVYNRDSGVPVPYATIFQTIYPHSWYLKQTGSQQLFLSGDGGLRWLDARHPPVTDFLFEFAKHLVDLYGPLQNWDRIRFAPNPGLGLEAERANPLNIQTKFVSRLSEMLKERGGAMWGTVIKHAVKTQKGLYHISFGQHWNTKPWADAVQMFIPMTYFDDMQSFKLDIEKMISESKELNFKLLPIVGLDMSIGEMNKRYPDLLAKQRNYVSSKVGQGGIIGYADWYYWPSFKPYELIEDE